MEWEYSDSSTVTLSCPNQKLCLSQEEEPFHTVECVEKKEVCCQTDINMNNSVIFAKNVFPFFYDALCAGQPSENRFTR